MRPVRTFAVAAALVCTLAACTAPAPPPEAAPSPAAEVEASLKEGADRLDGYNEGYEEGLADDDPPESGDTEAWVEGYEDGYADGQADQESVCGAILADAMEAADAGRNATVGDLAVELYQCPPSYYDDLLAYTQERLDMLVDEMTE